VPTTRLRVGRTHERAANERDIWNTGSGEHWEAGIICSSNQVSSGGLFSSDQPVTAFSYPSITVLTNWAPYAKAGDLPYSILPWTKKMAISSVVLPCRRSFTDWFLKKKGHIFPACYFLVCRRRVSDSGCSSCCSTSPRCLPLSKTIRIVCRRLNSVLIYSPMVILCPGGRSGKSTS